MRVVIADDDGDAAESLAELLRLCLDGPLEVAVANDGAGAVAAATGTRAPDAVILDIEMPRMNGFDAALAIRGALGSATTLIAVSGHVGRSELAGLTTTFDHALRKPIDVEHLLALLQAVPAR